MQQQYTHNPIRWIYLCMLFLLHAIIPCFAAWFLPCLLHFLHFHPYIIQHFKWKMFLHLFHCFLATRVFTSHTPFTPTRLSPTFLWNVDCTCSNTRWLPTNKEVLDLYSCEWSYKDSLSEGKELFHVEYLCQCVVGQFNWIRRWWTNQRFDTRTVHLFVSKGL